MVLDAKPLTPYAEALNKATLEVRENAQPGFTSGLFHQETERGQRLRAEATKPLPTTFAQALDLKRKDLGAGTIQNDESQIAAWKEHTGKETLSSLTPTDLNTFVRWLNQSKFDGGRGMGKDSANNYGLKRRSLIKATTVPLQRTLIASPSLTWSCSSTQRQTRGTSVLKWASVLPVMP